MKQIFTLLFVVIFFGNVWSQCPSYIYFSSQQQIDDFPVMYPNCTQAITIEIGYPNVPSDINDLSSLNQLVSAKNIYFNETALVNLTGLENLNSIEKELIIFNNNDLTSLQGLENITSIGDLKIDENAALTNLTELENLTSIDNLYINENPALISLAGLEGITSINGYLSIRDNNALTNLTGLDNLMSVGRYLSIGYNDFLTDLEGLNTLMSVGEYFHIAQNLALTSLAGLENLNFISGELLIWYNPNLVGLTGLGNLNFTGNLKIIGNALTNLTGLESLSSTGNLNIKFNSSMTSLIGLESLTSTGYLIIEDNDNLVSLVGLNNLTSINKQLDIKFNDALTSLTGLESLNSVGEYLKIVDNISLMSLTGLNGLTSVDEYLTISRNSALSSLTGLENMASINSMYINDNNALISLTGLENLSSVNEDLQIWRNDNLASLIGLENLSSVRYFSVVDNNALTSLAGLENVNAVRELFITYNGNLIDLTGLENIDYSTMSNLRITNNEALNTCSLPNICNYLASGGQNQIENNALNCANYATVIDNCGSLPKIKSQIFNDINQNGLRDVDEPYLYGINVSIEPAYSNVLFNETSGGIFYIEPGSYLATYKQTANPNWTLSTDSSSYFLSLDEGVCDTITFGLYPAQIISQAPVITSAPTLCNETLAFDISFKNLDTAALSGILWLEVDDNIVATNFINMPDTMVIPDRYGWFFDSLDSNDNIEKQVALQIPGPPDFSEGNTLVLYAYADFESGNGTLSSPIFTYTPQVSCFQTSNDKLVHPSRTGDYVLFEENLIYTIRFQNTGNGIVNNVVIRDTLDANLALETFRLLSSSHSDELNTNISADGVLTFEFNNIALPDSTSNFEGSQGHVTYLIRATDGLVEATSVTNSAGIYFDLNPPVTTNTTQSLMMNVLPALPVEIITPLRVNLSNRTAILKWRTATETNNSGFEIQRSKDGVNWEKIGWQAGQGTTYISYAYQHKDSTPLSGTSYYRLKQIDFDGQFEYSNIVSLRYSLPIADIFPNPTDGKFHVKSTAQGKYQIHDTTGRIIQTGELKNDLSIDISQEAQGVYFISIQMENEMITKRIIKM